MIPRAPTPRDASSHGEHSGAETWTGFVADPALPANAPTWRRYSDAVNARLVARWLDGRVDRVLKTDLFDEALTGGLVPVLSARAARVTAIDASPGVVEAARARHPSLEVVRADVRSLPFADGAFDAIVSNSTLDHLPGWPAIEDGVAELRRVLAPGGRLVATFDNAANPVVAVRAATALRLGTRLRARLAPYEQGPAASPARLRALLERAGFDVLATDCVVHCPRVAAIEIAARLDARDPDGAARRARRMLAFEHLGRLPTRAATGYFAAALAVRRG